MKYRTPAFCLLFLLVCYAAIFQYFGYWLPEPLWADGPSYLECGRLFFQESFQPHPVRPFGCALLFGWPYLWNWPEADVHRFARVVQFVFWMGSVILVWRISLKINAKYAHWVALIYGLNIGTLVFSRHINSETSFVFFMLLALLAWFRFCRYRRRRWLVMAFAGVCFATLIRPSGQYFVSGLLLLLLVQAVRHFYHERALSVWLAPGILALIFFLTIGVRVAQMNKSYRVVSMTIIQDFDLYVYLAGYSELWHLTDRHQRGEAWRQQSDSRWAVLATISDSAGYDASCRYARAAFFNRLREAPLEVVRTYCRNIFSNSVAPSFYIARMDTALQRPMYGAVLTSLRIISRIQNLFCSVLILFVIPVMLTTKLDGFRSAMATLRATFSTCHVLPFWTLGWLSGLYIMLSSAIVFAAGDRHHLTIVPFALISLYALMHHRKKL